MVDDGEMLTILKCSHPKDVKQNVNYQILLLGIHEPLLNELSHCTCFAGQFWSTMFPQEEIMKKKGKFGPLWLAAIRPKSLTKKEYKAVDVPSKCKELLEIPFTGKATDDGKVVKSHISLAHMSNLILGAARINNKQADYLINDMMNMKQAMKKEVTIELPPPTSRQLAAINIEEPNYDIDGLPSEVPEHISAPKDGIPAVEGSPLVFTVDPATVTMIEPPPFPPIEPVGEPQGYVPEEDMSSTFLGQDEMAKIILSSEPRIEGAEALLPPARAPVSPETLGPRTTEPPTAVTEIELTAAPKERRPVKKPPPPAELKLLEYPELSKDSRRRRQVRKKARPIIDKETKISSKEMRKVIIDDKICTTELEVVDIRKKTADELFSAPGQRILSNRLRGLWSKMQTRRAPDFGESFGGQYERAEESESERIQSTQTSKRLETTSAAENLWQPTPEMVAVFDFDETDSDKDVADRDESGKLSPGMLPTRPSISAPPLLARSSLMPVPEDLEITGQVPLPEDEGKKEEEQECISPSYTPPPPSPAPSECGAFKKEVLKQVTHLMEGNEDKGFVSFRDLMPKTKKDAAKTFSALLDFHATRMVDLSQEKPYEDIKIRLTGIADNFPETSASTSTDE